jgi:tetratricopeptide (TPR) repeat protein
MYNHKNIFQMKKYLLFVIAFVTCHTLFAQTADDLQKLARRQAMNEQYDSAYQTLIMALKQKPNDLGLLKDQVMVCFAKRDFENGLQIGMALVQRPDADEQCYQALGYIYKSLAEYKEGAKMYRQALDKFPTSGVLYSEYGDLLWLDNSPKDAIGAWEKGIQQDVNSYGNYYYASKYYLATNNLLWGLLYGEIFVNIESYTPRTDEMKQLLYDGYKKLFTGNALEKANANSKGMAKAVSDVLLKDAEPLGNDTIAGITSIREKFIPDWVNSGNAKNYPFRLFDLHRQLVEAKTFAAYNEWLFGDASNASRYAQWTKNHAAEMQQWQQLLHNVVFKIPAGQYYSN